RSQKGGRHYFNKGLAPHMGCIIASRSSIAISLHQRLFRFRASLREAAAAPADFGRSNWLNP
ncbi:MAG: hypothetical protein WCF79_23770, partial [Rhodomicrobium sp.]